MLSLSFFFLLTLKSINLSNLNLDLNENKLTLTIRPLFFIKQTISHQKAVGLKQKYFIKTGRNMVKFTLRKLTKKII